MGVDQPGSKSNLEIQGRLPKPPNRIALTDLKARTDEHLLKPTIHGEVAVAVVEDDGPAPSRDLLRSDGDPSGARRPDETARWSANLQPLSCRVSFGSAGV